MTGERPGSVCGARQDYGIGPSFERCLAGADTVVELAKARHRKYQTDRGRPSSLNS
jgi:hypothetical protein